MKTVVKPQPVNKQIKLDKYKYIMSSTDERGHIRYANDYFAEISGYSITELIGQNHNIIRHPDMPAVIFQLMWERLKDGKQIHAVVKNMAKSGEYYWVTTKLDIRQDPSDSRIVKYIAFRQAASPNTIKKISELYKELLIIEKSNGVDASLEYLISFLEQNNSSYDEFIDSVIENNSMMKMFFKAMSSFFNNH